ERDQDVLPPMRRELELLLTSAIAQREVGNVVSDLQAPRRTRVTLHRAHAGAELKGAHRVEEEKGSKREQPEPVRPSRGGERRRSDESNRNEPRGFVAERPNEKFARNDRKRSHEHGQA